MCSTGNIENGRDIHCGLCYLNNKKYISTNLNKHLLTMVGLNAAQIETVLTSLEHPPSQ
jgi:hypothetical protein